MTKRPLLLFLLLGAAGCERPRESGSVHTPRKLVLAAPPASVDTPPKVVPVATPPSVDTTHWQASPAMISEACHAFAAILSATATAKGMSAAEVGAPRDTVMTFGEMQHVPVESACRVAWRNFDARETPLDDVFARARAAGWTERDRLLLADGPDGSVMAVSRDNVACVVSGSWDGGDDSDSTYVPSPGFEIAASCFVNRPDRY